MEEAVTQLTNPTTSNNHNSINSIAFNFILGIHYLLSEMDNYTKEHLYQAVLQIQKDRPVATLFSVISLIQGRFSVPRALGKLAQPVAIKDI